jgi:hypothetical protein
LGLRSLSFRLGASLFELPSSLKSNYAGQDAPQAACGYAGQDARQADVQVSVNSIMKSAGIHPEFLVPQCFITLFITLF